MRQAHRLAMNERFVDGFRSLFAEGAFNASLDNFGDSRSITGPVG